MQLLQPLQVGEQSQLGGHSATQLVGIQHPVKINEIIVYNK